MCSDLFQEESLQRTLILVKEKQSLFFTKNVSSTSKQSPTHWPIFMKIRICFAGFFWKGCFWEGCERGLLRGNLFAFEGRQNMRGPLPRPKGVGEGVHGRGVVLR